MRHKNRDRNRVMKYQRLLTYFGVRHEWDELLETSSYVSMDNIHDAIVYEGVFMQKPFTFYVIKAKQKAIDEQNKAKRQKNLRKGKEERLCPGDIDYEDLDKYGFTSEELDLIFERLQGIPACRSAFQRRTYQTMLASVKAKIQAEL